MVCKRWGNVSRAVCCPSGAAVVRRSIGGGPAAFISPQGREQVAARCRAKAPRWGEAEMNAWVAVAVWWWSRRRRRWRRRLKRAASERTGLFSRSSSPPPPSAMEKTTLSQCARATYQVPISPNMFYRSVCLERFDSRNLTSQRAKTFACQHPPTCFVSSGARGQWSYD